MLHNNNTTTTQQQQQPIDIQIMTPTPFSIATMKAHQKDYWKLQGELYRYPEDIKEAARAKFFETLQGAEACAKTRTKAKACAMATAREMRLQAAAAMGGNMDTATRVIFGEDRDVDIAVSIQVQVAAKESTNKDELNAEVMAIHKEKKTMENIFCTAVYVDLTLDGDGDENIALRIKDQAATKEATKKDERNAKRRAIYKEKKTLEKKRKHQQQVTVFCTAVDAGMPQYVATPQTSFNRLQRHAQYEAALDQIYFD